MKSNAKKLLSLFSAALLVVSTQSHVVSAKALHEAEGLAATEVCQAEDAQVGPTEKKAEPLQLKREDSAIRYAEAIGKNTAEQVQDTAMAVDAAEADDASVVYMAYYPDI